VTVAEREGSVVIRHDPVAGPPERDVFAPRHDGTWTHHDQVWTGCAWRTRGVERARDLTVSGGD
jgi:hypothetical protein